MPNSYLPRPHGRQEDIYYLQHERPADGGMSLVWKDLGNGTTSGIGLCTTVADGEELPNA